MKPHVLLAMIISLFLLSSCATTEEMQHAQVKRITPEELEKLIPIPIATYTLEQIVVDSKQAKTPDEIIDKIKLSESRYDLSTSELLELNKQGVDVKVLDYIQESNELAKQNYIAEEINKAEKEKAEALRKLRQERLFLRHRYYDPFWHSRFGLYYGHPRWSGSRFGWGLDYGW